MEHIVFAHARMGSIQAVRECLEHDPSLLNTVSTITSRSLLHLAIENGHYSLTETLLRDFQAQLDNQCLYLAVHDAKDLFGYSIFKRFGRTARYEMVKLLLCYDSQLLYCDTSDALLCAVEQNYIRITKLLLEKGKADPVKLDDNGRGPLHVIFDDDDPRDVEDAIKMTKILCKYGAMLNMQQPSLVLHQAILVKGYEQLVFYMINKGADIYKVDETNGSKNAIDIALESRLDDPDLPCQLEKAWLNRSNNNIKDDSDNDEEDDVNDEDIEDRGVFDDHEYGKYHDVDATTAVFGAMDESQIENSLQNLPDTVKSTYNFLNRDLKKMSYLNKLRLYQLIMCGGQGSSFYDEDYDQDESVQNMQGNLNDMEDEEDEEETQRALEARLAWLKKMEQTENS